MQSDTGPIGTTRAAVDLHGDYRLAMPPPPPPPSFTFDRVVRFIVGATIVVAVGSVLWYFSGLIVYLLIGVLIAYLMRPLVDRIQGIGLGRIPAIFASFLLVFGAFVVLLIFLFPFAARQVGDLWEQIKVDSAVQITGLLPGTAEGRATLQPGDVIASADGVVLREADQLAALVRDKTPGETVMLVVQNAAEQERTVRLVLGEPAQADGPPEDVAPQDVALGAMGLTVRTVRLSGIVREVETRLSEVVPVQEGMILNAVTGVFETLFQEDRLGQVMGSVVGFFTDVFYAVIIIPFVTFFMLKDGVKIRKSMLRPVPNRYFEITLALIEKVETLIGRYFMGLMVQCLSIGALATLLLTLVGLNSAVAVGIFAGLANTIPYFGPLMGFLAGALVGVAQTGDFSLILPVLIAMGLTQIADNLLFQPLIFSRVARAHPLIILFVVLIGAQLGGIIGMLVAIPLMTIVRVTAQQVTWSLRNYRILRAIG